MEWWQALLLAIGIGWAGWVSITTIQHGKTLSSLLKWSVGKDQSCKGHAEWIARVEEKVDRNLKVSSETHGCVKALLERMK